MSATEKELKANLDRYADLGREAAFQAAAVRADAEAAEYELEADLLDAQAAKLEEQAQQWLEKSALARRQLDALWAAA